MKNIILKDEFIKLGQALKLSGMVQNGVDAKFIIQDGFVKVNGETEMRRGRKLYAGDVIEYNNQEFTVLKKEQGN